MASEEQQQQQQQQQQQRSSAEAEEKELVYKTKVIQFLGRTTPIILQNDNGPCPLLAICNVLLLRNNLNLSMDISEISPQKLLSLVAERLIDSNSNIENKDVGYVENQQQNIADAIDLLPRLMTGIDVNIQFRRIDDFEFTRECAIFDLLDIPLYHGWIVDPQDTLTANAIGAKSYNTLMGELVALETRNTESEQKRSSEEDYIDFAAATTATLGVPSPSLSRTMSFSESPHSMSDHQMARKGDLEEEAELLRVLQLSNTGDPTPSHESGSIPPINNMSSVESTVLAGSETSILTDNLEGHPADQQNLGLPEVNISRSNDASSSGQNGTVSSSMGTSQSISESSAGSRLDSSKESEDNFGFSDLQLQTKKDEVVSNQTEPEGVSSISSKEHVPSDDQQVQQTSSVQIQVNDLSRDAMLVSGTPATNADSDLIDLTDGLTKQIAVPKGETSSIDGSEPMYEGEDHIHDTEPASYESREPMYEGEMVLAEQAENDIESPCNEHPKCDITQQDGDLIRNFLRNSASQLTVYGLFGLQDGLKERELCVFFRNNHFNTMFKFNGELYLLATDQGYINQPDLVWEKLNEVNGDTVFMTGNFTEFKVDSHVNDGWNEQNAMANTADYLANFDNSAPEGSTMNSDLQLAIALQQQEFENQPQSQPQRQHNSQQAPSGGQSRLITGPQRSSASNSPRKQEAKTKDKCTVM